MQHNFPEDETSIILRRETKRNIQRRNTMVTEKAGKENIENNKSRTVILKGDRAGEVSGFGQL